MLKDVGKDIVAATSNWLLAKEIDDIINAEDAEQRAKNSVNVKANEA